MTREQGLHRWVFAVKMSCQWVNNPHYRRGIFTSFFVCLFANAELINTIWLIPPMYSSLLQIRYRLHLISEPYDSVLVNPVKLHIVKITSEEKNYLFLPLLWCLYWSVMNNESDAKEHIKALFKLNSLNKHHSVVALQSQQFPFIHCNAFTLIHFCFRSDIINICIVLVAFEFFSLDL